MAKFIECKFYPHNKQFDGELFFILGCCHQSCLNTAMIKEFDAIEMHLRQNPEKPKIVAGTRLKLTDNSILYVPIAYSNFKKMVM